jgi:hypothetical protein
MPEMQESHINILELKTVLIAAEKWGPDWRGKHILVRTDNTATLAAINKGSSRSVEMLQIIQKMFWLSVEFGFKLSASFVPGRLNLFSDMLSRLHEVDKAWDAIPLISLFDLEVECVGHITEATFLFLQGAWAQM